MESENIRPELDKAAAPARYEAGQVVLADVDHVRAYRGETDELLYRMRSAEAEEEFMRVLDGLREPDWFVERWDGERKVLVACLVFEREADARRCEEALAASVEGGEAKTVWPREDAAMRDEVARYFSAEWEKAHAAEMAKVDEAYAKAVAEFGGRIVVGWVGGGLDAEKRRWRFERFGRQVKSASAGLLAHAGVDDDVLGRVNFALGFGDDGAAKAFVSGLGEMRGMDDVTLDVIGECHSRGEGFCETIRQMVVAMAKRLGALGAKKG